MAITAQNNIRYILIQRFLSQNDMNYIYSLYSVFISYFSKVWNLEIKKWIIQLFITRILEIKKNMFIEYYFILHNFTQQVGISSEIKLITRSIMVHICQ